MLNWVGMGAVPTCHWPTDPRVAAPRFHRQECPGVTVAGPAVWGGGMPLFNRIAVVVMAGAMLAILAMTAWSEVRQGLDPGMAVLGSILAGVGLFLLWCGLCCRARKPDAAEAAAASGAPVGMPDAIRCHFTGVTGSPRAVIADRSRNTISFDHCFVPRKWLAGPSSTVQCSMDEIVVVYAYHSLAGQVLRIVTVGGTAEVAERTATGFTDLRDALSCYAQPNRSGYELDDPRFSALGGLVYFGGAVVGVGAGLGCVPWNASVGTVALAMLVGGVCGMIGSKLLIHGVYRLWQVELVTPLGCGVGGAALAMIGGVNCGPFVGWDWRVTIAPILLGFLGGVVFGLWVNHRAKSA